MSIRGYKDIYSMFSSMFPKLSGTVKSWKGVKFRDKHITIRTTDGLIIHFQYFNSQSWYLYCNPCDNQKARTNQHERTKRQL